MDSVVPQKVRDYMSETQSLRGYERGTDEFTCLVAVITNKRMWKAIYEVWSEFISRPNPLPFPLSLITQEQPSFEEAVRFGDDDGEFNIEVEINSQSESLVIEIWLSWPDGNPLPEIQLNTGYHRTSNISDLCNVIESKKFRTRFTKC